MVEKLKKEDLVGVWKLIEFAVIPDKEEKFYPYGKNPIGYLLYTADGFVSVHFMRKERTTCQSNDFRGISLTEKSEVADNYGGYVGRYEIQDNCLVHHLEVCSFPNYLQYPQIRQYEYTDNGLILKCPYLGDSAEERGLTRISWKR